MSCEGKHGVLASGRDELSQNCEVSLTLVESSVADSEIFARNPLQRKFTCAANEKKLEGFSSQTHMSHTGVLSDDSTEIDYSFNVPETEDMYVNRKSVEGILCTKITNRNTECNDSVKMCTAKPNKGFHCSSSPCKLASESISLFKFTDSAPARYSHLFESSVADHLCSTLNQCPMSESPLKYGSSNDSYTKSNLKEETIVDISSDSNNSISFFNEDGHHAHWPSAKPIQSKIISSLSKTPSPYILSERKVVSREFYDTEEANLKELKSDLESAEDLLEKLGSNLFDGGKQLRMRVQNLRSCVKAKTDEIAKLVIREKNQPATLEGTKKISKDFSDWEALSTAVNEIKPVFTGKQALNTFNKQKTLTIERLKDLHGSIETCPGEDILADDPKELKVTLMIHQKHALAWMIWRESQKPRGGILADDMGLGKTLTMISLILSSKNRDVNRLQDSFDEENDDNVCLPSKNRTIYYNGGTLVICPASLLRQWECEIENKVNRHKLSVCVHHGNNRDTKSRNLATYDVVITTYNIVSREAKTLGALFLINWNRLILDEAHIIRNYKNQSSEAVCALRGVYRWVLTGTPIQNKEMDVYALLKFLKCSPFDDLSHWKKWIDNKSAGGQQRLNTLMKSLMLRRTKVQLQQKESLMCLPKRNCKLIEVILNKEEMNVYQKIMTYSKTLFKQFLCQRAEKNNDFGYGQDHWPTFMQKQHTNDAYHKMHQKFSKMHNKGKEIKSHEILVLLLRLRQICCHCGLIDAMLEDGDENAASDSDSSELEIDLLEQINKLAIHGDDDLACSSSDDKHKVISKASAKVLQRSNPVFDLSRPSSKMNKVLQIIENYVIISGDKAIIISQWTRILNILKRHLEDKGIFTLSLNGTIPVKNRHFIVTEFNDPNTRPKVLLLSLTAGGVGLNLVGANHLLLIDLHWNPQLEAQAQDRIYRVGQRKPVYIYKFMCKDTVEEQIKKLQDHKIEIANGILTGVKASEGSKLSIDDLKGLFGL